MKNRDVEYARREFLFASGSLALFATLGTTSIQGRELPGDFEPILLIDNFDEESINNIGTAAWQCVLTAEACIDYFTNESGLSAEDSAQCVAHGKAMVAVAKAVASLASIRSAYLAHISVAAIDLCNTCEDECNTHKNHNVCVDCAKACRSFIDACDRLTVYSKYHL